MTAYLLLIAATALQLAALATAFRAGARTQQGDITIRALGYHVILMAILMSGSIMSARYLWDPSFG